MNSWKKTAMIKLWTNGAEAGLLDCSPVTAPFLVQFQTLWTALPSAALR